MKDLMRTNCYDISDNIIIVGSCLPKMQPNAYNKLKNISDDIYELCLETTHLNMAITKLIGMLSRVNVKNIIFATVDKSPHCVQIHYIQDELQKMMNLSNVIIENYVVVNNELIKIVPEIISLSKNLKELSELRNKVGDKNE